MLLFIVPFILVRTTSRKVALIEFFFR